MLLQRWPRRLVGPQILYPHLTRIALGAVGWTVNPAYPSIAQSVCKPHTVAPIEVEESFDGAVAAHLTMPCLDNDARWNSCTTVAVVVRMAAPHALHRLYRSLGGLNLGWTRLI